MNKNYWMEKVSELTLTNVALIQKNNHLKAKIEELEDLRKMILDAESADASLIPFMYQTWLHKAKQAGDL